MQAKQSYGRWLKWLLQENLIDAGAASASLIVPGLVKRFVRAEMERIKTASICNIVCHLMGIAKSAAPDEDWGWLLTILHDLDKRASREPRSTPRTVPSQDLNALGFALMQDPLEEGFIDAEACLDGLLIAVLIAEVQRVGAFAAMELDKHIRRGPSQWHVLFDAAMTKTKRTERGTLPASLTPFIDCYVNHLRHRFLQGDPTPSKRLWIGSNGKPLSANAIRERIKFRTKKAFGFPICPHSFRRSGYTTFIENAPQSAGCGHALLGNSKEVAETHYLIPQPARALRFFHTLLDGQPALCNESRDPRSGPASPRPDRKWTNES